MPLPHLQKNYNAFFDILAFPKDAKLHFDFLINSQAFLSLGFLKVLPQVLILLGWELFSFQNIL